MHSWQTNEAEQASTSVAIGELLMRMAFELDELTEQSRTMESLIGDGLHRRDAPLSDREIRGLQALDRTTQLLADLSLFARTLAGEAEGNWRVDGAAAAAPLHLSALAARLGGGPEPVGSLQSGDFENF